MYITTDCDSKIWLYVEKPKLLTNKGNKSYWYSMNAKTEITNENSIALIGYVPKLEDGPILIPS